MRKSEKTSVKVLRVIEKIAHNEAERARWGWPPICMGISHQPKRPKKKEN